MLKRLVGRGFLALMLVGMVGMKARAESDVFPFDEGEAIVVPAAVTLFISGEALSCAPHQ